MKEVMDRPSAATLACGTVNRPGVVHSVEEDLL